MLVTPYRKKRASGWKALEVIDFSAEGLLHPTGRRGQVGGMYLEEIDLSAEGCSTLQEEEDK